MTLRVAVFGLGYVGCVTAACLAKAGHDVVGVDLNPDKVALIESGASPVVEPGLDTLIGEVVGTGTLRATLSAADAVNSTDVALVCVGTPGKVSGELDVSALVRVIREIGEARRHSSGRYAVVVRSTVLPGTTEGVLVPALLNAVRGVGSGSVSLAVNPEFMREGSSLQDFANPPLTLVGCDDPQMAELFRLLYRDITAPFVLTSIRTAEMLKYVANGFHALKVAFANEVGDLCEAFGVDAQELMRIFLLDRKLSVSDAYLRPGFAFGGSCLPKDLRAVLYAARTRDVSLPVLGAVLPSNEGQIRRGIDAVLATRKRRVGVVGLAFKAGTDDLRESPIVAVVEALIGKGCDVRILDPHVSVGWLMGANRRYIEEEIPHIAALMCHDIDTLLRHAEVVVIGTVSEEARVATESAGPHRVVIDLTRAIARVPASARSEQS